MHPVQYAALAVLFTVFSVTGGFLYLRRHRPVEPLTVTLTADTSQFEEAMRKMGRAWGDMKLSVGTAMFPAMAAVGKEMVSLTRAMERMRLGLPAWYFDPKLREVHVAGLEAKMYVRAGMDHQVATPEALDRLVKQIHHEPHLTPEERGQVIAAAYRGWVNHRPLEQGGGLAFVATTGPAPLVLDVFPR
jgi:hypothetical protein